MNANALDAVAPLLSVSGLSKHYGGVRAIDELEFSLPRGAVLGIIGPNGAGKSTLIGLLGGALRPTAGRIQFNGADVTRWPAAERARLGIGRTYQIPRPFLELSVRENLLAGQYALQPLIARRQAIAASTAILERTGLADAADLPARALPLLRRKRLEVARALALRPRLLLLDEVGAGLVDSEVGELITLIKALARELEGLIIIEHVLRVVRECCAQLMVVNFGRKLAEGPTAEVLASEQVAAVYLGTAHGGGAPSAAPAAAVSGLTSLVAAEIPQRAASAVALLELREVHAGYGLARVLNGVSLTVRAGQAVAILGTNGAGKTTLAGVISGLIRPTAGALYIDGIDRTGTAAHVIARLGLAQCMEGRRIFAPLSVEENLLLAAGAVGKLESQRRLDQVYQLFPVLRERRSQGGTSMSGGQQQMLAIGRALMSRPRLIVFDEISLGLAPLVMDQLYAALAALRDAGLTLLIVEQDVQRALDLADEVHVMEHGRIALSGTAAQVRENPVLRHLYIGTAD
jgi:ABC-type branched-subunit amino acid transport system ATPase component